MSGVSGNKIVLTDAARAVLDEAKAVRGPDLTLVIGNGCCDSTAPFLFSEHVAGPNELPIGEVGDVPVLLDESLEDSFAGSEVVIDAARDPQPDSFSCEAELGYRFMLERLPSPLRS